MLKDLGILLDLDELIFNSISSDWETGLSTDHVINPKPIGAKLKEDLPEDEKKKLLKEMAEEVDLESVEKDEDSETFVASLFDDKYVVRVKYDEDYKQGDLDKIAPGTYLEVIKVHPIYLQEGLFGYTYPEGGLAVYVRSDLRGEALRRVIRHEVAHHAMRLGEEAARDATGTHMHEFLPIFERSKYN